MSGKLEELGGDLGKIRIIGEREEGDCWRNRGALDPPLDPRLSAH